MVAHVTFLSFSVLCLHHAVADLTEGARCSSPGACTGFSDAEGDAHPEGNEPQGDAASLIQRPVRSIAAPIDLTGRVFTKSDTLYQKPRTAMCVAGNARSFSQLRVMGSFPHLLDNMNSVGMVSSTPVDIYAYLTAGGDGWNNIRTNLSESLTALHAVAFEIGDGTGNITESNIDDFVVNRHLCFSGGLMWHDPSLFARSLNQLAHIQSCLELVTKRERTLSKQYEVVIVARPDLQYTLQKPLDLVSVAFGAASIHQGDQFIAMSRLIMSRLLDPKRAKPLSCHPGESCCGKISYSEEMFSHLLGFDVESLKGETRVAEIIRE